MQDIPILADYKILEPRTVAWGDMDAMRHVNNTKYFFYCETARLGFLTKAFPEVGTSEAQNNRVGIALAETACRFKVSLTFPDEVVIATGVTKIEETQFELKHVIYSKKLDLIAAEATARMVHFDFTQGKRAIISDQMRAILEQYSV